MSPRQLRLRATARFTVLTIGVALYFLLAHAAVAGIALAVGL